MSSSAEYNNCTLDTCSIDKTVLRYRPSVVANSLLLALFAISMVIHLGQGIVRRSRSFAIIMAIGCVTEIIGYVGRLISWHNPFSQAGFLTHVVCLTIGPAFYAAAIYLCISKIVMVLGPEFSRIPPKGYYYLLVPCDVISLVLQGTGGGLSSVLSQRGEDPSVGSNVMIAGLAFQVFTMVVFMALCADYGFRYWRSRRAGPATTAAAAHASPISRKLQLFFACLTLATLCIFIRSVYRVVELAGGWTGKLLHDQPKFIVLEGVMVILACLALNIGHPNLLPPSPLDGPNVEKADTSS